MNTPLGQQITRRSAIVGTGATVVAAALLAACSNGSQPSAKGSGGSKTLTVDVSFALKGLDPGTVYEPTGNMIVHALYDTLLTFEGSQITTPKPALASSYTASPDGRKFTFHLNPHAKFADKSPVTSADVLWSLRRLQNLKGSAAPIVTNLSFAAPDEHTVVVTSSVPDPTVPAMLTGPYASILNSKLAKQHGGTDAADAAKTDSLTQYLKTHALGSGPYTVSAFNASSQVVLTASPAYWRAAPAYARVVIQNTSAQNQKLVMAKSPSDTIALDISGTLLSGLPKTLHVTKSPDTYWQLRLSANPAVSTITSNRKWAHALRAAIDYQGAAQLFGKTGIPATGPIPPVFAGGLPASDAQRQNLPEAKKLLAASGVGTKTVKMLYPAISFTGVDIGTVATAIQRDAAQAGINIQLDPAPISSFLAQRDSAKVPLSFSPQQFNYPAAASAVPDAMPGGHTATAAGWTAARADRATVAAGRAVLAATSATKQDQALQKWQKLMVENGPYITVCYSSGSVVASANLSGADYTSAGWEVSLGDIRPA